MTSFRDLYRPRILRTSLGEIPVIDRGDGPPMFLLHGGGTWSYSWRAQIEPLSQWHRLIAPDLPGHGYATPGRVIDDPQTMVDGIRELMDVTKIESADLTGHSWGGGWALRFALQHPERVRRLTLIASSGLDVRDRWDWELLKLPVLGAIASRWTNRRVVRRALEAAFADSSRVTDDVVEETFLPLSQPWVRESQRLLMRNTSWSSIDRHLSEISIPTLILWGDRDQYLAPAHGRTFLLRMRDARLELIPNAGHAVHEEAPSAVNASIEAFLDESISR